MKRFSVLLCCVVTIAAVQATDYCSKSLCPRGVTHIACKKTKDFDINCPKGARMVPFNQTIRQVILHEHNKKRSFIAGGKNPNLTAACRMATFKWDKKLAETSTYKARECATGHDACHNTPDFSQSGQNLARFGYYPPLNETKELTAIFQAFYNEVENVTQSHIHNCTYSKLKIDHFMVMMLEYNTHLGCAASTYPEFGKPYWNFLVVCNYARVHISGLPVYKTCQKPAKDCKKKSFKYPGLCHVSENYKT